MEHQISKESLAYIAVILEVLKVIKVVDVGILEMALLEAYQLGVVEQKKQPCSHIITHMN